MPRFDERSHTGGRGGGAGLCRALCAAGRDAGAGAAGRGVARRGRRGRIDAAPGGWSRASARIRRLGGIEDFLHAYSLSTKEGLALMVLAEALLRVPDAATADR
jgi:RHH-type proline utilization regulon transcriptional repressor/proline dehydrogenase/delta 1-pyrroline-5-carboxylate dehydrogenase